MSSSETVTGGVWTVHRYHKEFCGDDCWEPFNRSMFGIFNWCMESVVDPFCYIYSSVIPKPLIESIDNCCENVEYPQRLVADLGMGEGALAWDDTKRFGINTTLGIGGLFDPAQKCFGIWDDKSSLSDTFAYWNVPSGPLLALPFMPRASLRGHVGYVLDYAFDPKTWFDYIVPSGIFIGYSWSLTPNKAPVWRGLWEGAFGREEDPYAIYMPVVSALTDFNFAQRLAHVSRGDVAPVDIRERVRASAKRPFDLKGEWREIKGYAPRGPALDSLRALCFTPLGDDDFWWERRSIFNRDFSKGIEMRHVELPNGREASYSYIAPTGAEGKVRELVFVLPGIGAGQTSSDVVAMGELLHSAGYGVVLCDSIFHWESVRTVNGDILPGNLPEDTRRLAKYMQCVVDDLERDELVWWPNISIIGWSMGGLATLHLAAHDATDGLPFAVRRFVAINPPPTSFNRKMDQFARVMEASRGWSKQKAGEMFGQIVGALYGWALRRHPRFDPQSPPTDEDGAPWSYAPNLTEEQANYLMGLTMRKCLLSLVAQRHRDRPFPHISSEITCFHREEFYDEVGDVDIFGYLNNYLSSCYPEMTVEELMRQASVRRLEGALRRNDKLHVIHTWNDPLLDDSDRWYLDRVFGKRITWFADGAHCGYFYTKPFQEELLVKLKEVSK